MRARIRCFGFLAALFFALSALPAEATLRPDTSPNSDSLEGSLPQVNPAPPAAQPPAPPPPPPQEAIELTPLVFNPLLPETPVAWVNEKPITAASLLALVLEQNFSTGVSALVMGKILEIELKRAQVTLTDEDIASEMAEMVAQIAPGKSIEEVEKSGQTSLKHLRSQARTTRGWKLLFWTAQKVPEDQRTGQTQQLMMSFFIQQTMQRYDRKIRGQNPQPTIPGVVAQIVEKETNNEIVVGANEALDFLIGLVKQSGLLDARNELVDRAILEVETAKAGIKVSDDEVANWASGMRAKHPPPFTWEQICRIKGTTPEREMERWRRIQGWKRTLKEQPTDEQVLKFLEAHKSFFLGKTKKVSHILFRTTDDVTGLPLSPEKQKEALDNATMAFEKLQEGVDFGYLAETYSEDSVTAKGKGRLGQPIKEWGGGLDKAFQAAAWKLEAIGDMSGPVKSSFGWHVIKLEEINAPQAKQEPNWKEPRYWEWVTDEFDTMQMENFLEGLKKSAGVKLAPEAVIFELKGHDYNKI